MKGSGGFRSIGDGHSRERLACGIENVKLAATPETDPSPQEEAPEAP